MTLEIRPCTDDELPAWVATFRAAFGGQPGGGDAESWRPTWERERSLAAFDDGAMVGTAGAFSFDLTLPGLTSTPVAGVTAVGVLPTHRRQGILTRLMARQLADVAERGEALAILLASESIIYGRFGYGLASFIAAYALAVERAALATPPTAGGRVRLVDKDEAAKVLPTIYDAARRRQPGAVTRNQSWWDTHFTDRPDWRGGASARFMAVHESPTGEADGYVSYRIKSGWGDTGPDSELRIEDLCAVDDGIEAVLWRYCSEVDLVRTVKAFNRPVDEPFRMRLADPRQLRSTRVGDFLWARILDVPAALGARRYPVADRLVLEVADRFRPDTSGRYAVEGGPDHAACTRTDDQPDLALSIADLGALYLGGVRATTLAGAGRVEERTPGALARANLFFGSDRAPYCATGF